MVEGPEDACEFVGVEVGGGLGHRYSEPGGDRGDARRHQARVDRRGGLRAASERFGLIAAESDRGGEQVGEEGEIELAALEDPPDPVIVVRPEIVRHRTGMTPRGVRVGDGGGDQESTEMELTGHG